MSDTTIPIARILELAKRAALSPSALILEGYRSPSLSVERKSDGSPVTPFDREAERRIREVLRSDPELRWPVLGEELGGDTDQARFRWVVDPIDGTLPFSRGLPYFGTLLAFEETAARRALAGVIQLPASAELYSAGRGLGAHCNGTPITVAPRRELADCIVSVPDVGKFRAAGLAEGYERLSEVGPYFRGSGDCWMHAMTARGAVDALVEFSLHRWDIAASEVLVEEAGGRFLVRRSRTVPGKYDVIFGSPHAVDEVVRLLGFIPE